MWIKTMIDWDRVAELRSEIGDEDLAEVLDMFLEEVEEKLAELSAGMVAARLPEDMHFLKSSAMNIGFRRLAALCSAAETMARDSPEAVQLPEILECYAQSRTELATWRNAAAA